jgi:hypothetical protein
MNHPFCKMKNMTESLVFVGMLTAKNGMTAITSFEFACSHLSDTSHVAQAAI